MAHSDVALDIQCWCSSEPKSLHVGVDQGVIHVVGHAPSSLKLADEFIIYRAAMVVNQLDLFVGTVMSITVVNDNIKPV
jgi:hypothetical protein